MLAILGIRILLGTLSLVAMLFKQLDLAADDGTPWRARTATLLHWQRSDWRDYIALRRLPAQAQQQFHDALRLHLCPTPTARPTIRRSRPSAEAPASWLRSAPC